MNTKRKTIKVDDWRNLFQFYEECQESGDQWIFRGQRDSRWQLETSFERAAIRFGHDSAKVPSQSEERKECHRRMLAAGLKGRTQPRSLPDLERGLIRRFKRQCHQYIAGVPQDEDHLAWLALMQHHGAVTRLLDWTYSFFAALYFAVEDADGECAVWALNSDLLPKPTGAILCQYPDLHKQWERDQGMTEPETFRILFMESESPMLVAAVNPYKLHPRLVIQQGVFLCPSDITKPFEDNLEAILSRPEFTGRLVKLVICDETTLRKTVLQRLHRMNMNSATLFPGLDGFARSLTSLLVFPDVLVPDSIRFRCV